MNYALLMLAGIAGVAATFWVSGHLNYGPVRASALLSLLVGLLFWCFPNLLNPYLTQNIPPVFCGATFVGMVSAKVVSHYFTLLLAGILFVVIYLNASLFFTGYGGALGTAASISLMATLGFDAFLLKYRVYKRALLLCRQVSAKRKKEPED